MSPSAISRRQFLLGGIALQVHGGGDYTKQFVRYRNIRVKELKN